jgi:hypothetical protein
MSIAAAIRGGRRFATKPTKPLASRLKLAEPVGCDLCQELTEFDEEMGSWGSDIQGENRKETLSTLEFGAVVPPDSA